VSSRSCTCCCCCCCCFPANSSSGGQIQRAPYPCLTIELQKLVSFCTVARNSCWSGNTGGCAGSIRLCL
jgi:hypothetical protein